MIQILLHNFVKDPKGNAVTLTALALPFLLGATGLALEAGVWFNTKRRLQNITDAAALGGVVEVANGGLFLQTRTKTDVTANGFIVGGTNTLITNNPPKSGSYTADPRAVEVILSQQVPLIFSGIFLSSPITVTARSVATVKPPSNCVVALHTTASGAITLTGSASLKMTRCSIGVNSSNASAVTLSGTSNITTDSLSIVGKYSLGGSASITAKNGVKTGAPPTTDPYSSLAVPSYAGCNSTNLSLKGVAVKTISPGVYCGGITAGNSSVLTMNPGTYILDRGPFNISGAATVNGAGVTIILTSSTGASYGTVSVGNAARVTLTPPTSGPFMGVTFFQDRKAPTTGSNTFSGATFNKISGALYFPSQRVTYAGSASSATCLQLVAARISISGAASTGTTCSYLGSSSTTPRLVE